MPHPFKTLAEANAEHIALLGAAVETANVNHATALATLQTDLDTSRATGSAAIVERDQLRGQVTTLTGERDSAVSNLAAANTAHATALSAAQTVTTERVNSEVQRVTASQGIPRPVAADANKPADMTRKDFSSLSPGARAAHIRGGGKLTD